MGLGGVPCPKPIRGTRKRLKARRKRLERKETGTVRDYVFGRERNVCRVTRFLPAESMHELKPRSVGGKRSKRNSVAVYGDGVRGIHGLLQRHEITYRFEDEGLGAEGTIHFTAVTRAAAEAMKIPVGHTLVSPVMQHTEIEGF